MLVGKPKLAVWRRIDQTVRLFEMDNTGVFVQVSAFSGPTGNDVVTPTILSFSNNGNFIVTLDKLSKAADNIQVRSTDFAGNNLFQNLTGEAGAANQDTYFGVVSSIPGFNSVQPSYGGLLLYGSDAGEFAGQNSVTSLNLAYSVFDMDDAQTRAVFLSSTQLRFATVSNSSQRANFTFTSLVSLGGRVPQCAEWSHDGRFCAVGWNNGDIEIYSVNSSAVFTLLSTANIGESVNQVRWRFDNRILAVGHGTTPTTTLYKRKGNALYNPTTLAGIGTDLRWTADGQYLVDTVKQKAYRWTGDLTMVGADATMANIPSGVVSTAISPHVDQPIAAGLIYDAGFQAIVNKTVDLTNLKFALMDGSVVFNAGANSASSVLSGHEVTSADFPAGGTHMQNVSMTFPASAFGKIVADDILVATSVPLDFAQALLYDATNNTPIILYNYGTHHMDAFFTQRFAFDQGVVTLST